MNTETKVVSTEDINERLSLSMWLSPSNGRETKSLAERLTQAEDHLRRTVTRMLLEENINPKNGFVVRSFKNNTLTVTWIRFTIALVVSASIQYENNGRLYKKPIEYCKISHNNSLLVAEWCKGELDGHPVLIGEPVVLVGKQDSNQYAVGMVGDYVIKERGTFRIVTAKMFEETLEKNLVDRAVM